MPIDWSKLNKPTVARFLGVAESDILEILPQTLRLRSDSSPATTFDSIITNRLSALVKGLLVAFATEDDLGAVIRAHIHIEHELQELIFFAAPNSTQLKRFEEMEFSEKVQLALVLGLQPNLKAALKAAGTLRNKFSHVLDTKLTNDHANDLTGKLPADIRGLLTDIRRLLTVDEAKSLSKLEENPRGRIEVFFLALLMAVARERHRLGLERFTISTQ